MNAFEQGYESESLGLMFKDNPFPPKTEDHDQWIIGKCKAINEYRHIKRSDRAIIAYAE